MITYIIKKGTYINGSNMRFEMLPYETNDYRAADRRIRAYAEAWRDDADIIQHNAGESVVYFNDGSRFEFWRESFTPLTPYQPGDR